MWACGHIGFYQINRCARLFNGCKGTSAKHEMVYEVEECSDCQRRKNLPKPFVAR